VPRLPVPARKIAGFAGEKGVMEEKDREESLRRATEEVREGTRDASSG